MGLLIGLLVERLFHSLQQERRVAIHVLFLDEKLEEGRQDGEFGLHGLIAQAVWQLKAQLPFAQKGPPLGIGQPLSPLLVEYELGHVSIGDQRRWRCLKVVEVAHHDPPGEILWADGHLAKAPVQEGGQLAAIGLVVVFTVTLLQQPVDGQLIDEARIGHVPHAEVGQVLVDLRVASLQMEQAIEQRHGGRKWQMGHMGACGDGCLK
ncbi:hypothetical protein D3C80_1450320 [compost metagenome]